MFKIRVFSFICIIFNIVLWPKLLRLLKQSNISKQMFIRRNVGQTNWSAIIMFCLLPPFFAITYTFLHIFRPSGNSDWIICLESSRKTCAYLDWSAWVRDVCFFGINYMHTIHCIHIDFVFWIGFFCLHIIVIFSSRAFYIFHALHLSPFDPSA